MDKGMVADPVHHILSLMASMGLTSQDLDAGLNSYYDKVRLNQTIQPLKREVSNLKAQLENKGIEERQIQLESAVEEFFRQTNRNGNFSALWRV
jgi:hypothetical protein